MLLLVSITMVSLNSYRLGARACSHVASQLSVGSVCRLTCIMIYNTKDRQRRAVRLISILQESVAFTDNEAVGDDMLPLNACAISAKGSVLSMRDYHLYFVTSSFRPLPVKTRNV